MEILRAIGKWPERTRKLRGVWNPVQPRHNVIPGYGMHAKASRWANIAACGMLIEQGENDESTA
ncbi:MAG: hypothetical protein H0V16_02100 [Burkholderiaceae bacterium]|nr:hypothetical protein [Burkholderiaceae bacterium]